MSASSSQELLSAYLDGEVTPDEQSLVQRLLAEQPDLPEQLQELIEAQQLLQQLPRPAAPEDFAAEILSQLSVRIADRKTLPGKRQNKTSGPRLWISSCVAASLVLGAGVFLLKQQPPTVTSNSSIDRTMERAKIEFFDRSDSIVPVVADAEMADGLSAENLNFSSMSLEYNINPAPTPQVVALDRAAIVQHLNSLGELPQSGDELSILTDSEESPILVDFIVIDAQKTLGKLQVLLRNHSAVQLALSDASGTKKLSTDNSLVAVYLDLDEPELENVLSQVAALDATVFVDGDVYAPETNRFSKHQRANPEGGMAIPQLAQARPALAAAATQVSNETHIKTEAEEVDSLVANRRDRTNDSEKRMSATREQAYRFDLQTVRLSLGPTRSGGQLGKMSPNPADAPSEQFKQHEMLPELQHISRLPPAPYLPEKAGRDQSGVHDPEAKVIHFSAPGDAVSSPAAPQAATSKDSKIAEENIPRNRRIRAFLILREEQN